VTIQTKPLTGQCPHCGAPAWRLAYHSRYTLRSGQTLFVIRCRQCRKTFCDRFGTAFYDLKTPERRFSAPFNKGSKACALKPWRASKAFIRPPYSDGLIGPAFKPKPPTKKSSRAFRLRTLNWMNSIALLALNILTIRMLILTRSANIGRTSPWRVNHV
jgi:hypothetical protein